MLTLVLLSPKKVRSEKKVGGRGRLLPCPGGSITALSTSVSLCEALAEGQGTAALASAWPTQSCMCHQHVLLGVRTDPTSADAGWLAVRHQ